MEDYSKWFLVELSAAVILGLTIGTIITGGLLIAATGGGI